MSAFTTTKDEDIRPYPLVWPHGWVTIAPERRQDSRFEVNRSRGYYGIQRALRAMGCIEVTISMNVRAQNTTEMDRAGEPNDSGVAVYWTRKGVPGAMACDKYKLVRENLRALQKALDGLRAVEDSGASQVLDRIYSSLKALPAHIIPKRQWRDVLEIDIDVMPPASMIEKKFKELARTKHPDHGGSQDTFAELAHARDEALAEIEWNKKR